MSNQIILIIKINTTYEIQCIYIDSNNKTTTIQLQNSNQQEYSLSSSLIDNNSSIEFADDLFTNHKISNYMK